MFKFAIGDHVEVNYNNSDNDDTNSDRDENNSNCDSNSSDSDENNSDSDGNETNSDGDDGNNSDSDENYSNGGEDELNTYLQMHKNANKNIHNNNNSLCEVYGKNATAYSLLPAQTAFLPSTNTFRLQQPNALVRMRTNTDKRCAKTRSPT
jgi:hypothetical protein